MTIAFVLFAVGILVLILGRFHFLFREVTPAGNFPTNLSSWMRLGSIVIAGIFLWGAVITLIVVSRH